MIAHRDLRIRKAQAPTLDAALHVIDDRMAAEHIPHKRYTPVRYHETPRSWRIDVDVLVDEFVMAVEP